MPAQVMTWRDGFEGHRSYSATATSNAGHQWTITETSSAGTPTFAAVDDGGAPGVKLTFDNTNEEQNICLSSGDILWCDIDKIVQATFRVKFGGTAKDAATTAAWGLASERNDAIDSIAEAALFRLAGTSTTTEIVVETDDGTTNNDDVATGKTLSTTALDFTISFATGKSDVRFFIDGQPVATGTTFDMSGYSGSLQPYLQLQKTADTSTDSITLEFAEILYRIS